VFTFKITPSREVMTNDVKELCEILVVLLQVMESESFACIRLNINSFVSKDGFLRSGGFLY